MMGDISEATSIYILVYFNIKILLFIYINKLLHPNGYLEKVLDLIPERIFRLIRR